MTDTAYSILDTIQTFYESCDIYLNTRVHLKYNKVLIGDDQTNNDKI